MGIPDEESYWRTRFIPPGHATGWRRIVIYIAVAFFAAAPTGWLMSAIVRAIIRKDDFQWRIRLGEGGVNCFADESLLIKARDRKREQRLVLQLCCHLMLHTALGKWIDTFIASRLRSDSS